MKKSDLVQALKEYRSSMTKCRLLVAEAEEIERHLPAMDEEERIASTMGSLRNDGMPSGGMISNKVEAAGIRSLDGKESRAVNMWRKESEQLRREAGQLRHRLRKIDISMQALNEKERAVIQRHLIDGESFEELAEGSEDLFGDIYSRNTLIRWQNRGLEKMLHALEGTWRYA